MKPEHPPHEHPERPTATPPRIYVADLAAYNNGHLHGVWCNATDPLDAIWNQINAMLATSPIAGAEEIAVHDAEGFGPLHIGEYESLSTIARVGAGFAEHGEAFLHWAAYIGTSDQELDRFEDAYLGHWDSMEAYTEELIDDLGIEAELDQKLPEGFRPFIRIDIDGLARDLRLDLYEAPAANGGFHLFRP